MFSPDVVVMPARRLAQAVLQRFLGTGCERQVPPNDGAGGLVPPGCRHLGGLFAGLTATPAADQARNAAAGVPPISTFPVLDADRGLSEGIGSEGRLDPCAHGIEIDPDDGQRVSVQIAEQTGFAAEPDEANNLLLDVFGGDALLAQDCTGGLLGRSRSE